MKRPCRALLVMALCALGAEALTSAAALAQPAVRAADDPSPKELGRELARLYQEDQEDQRTWTLADDVAFSARQRERRDRVMEILALGGLTSMQDWDHAALLLQHGQGADDYLLAHVLSIPPGEENLPFGRFMAAATLDRFLMNVGRPQVFSTQSSAPDPSQFLLSEPFDTSMSEAVRAAYGLDPLPIDRAAQAEKGRSRAPRAKDLPKLLKAAKRDADKEHTPAEAPGEVPDWLADTRAIVLGDTLESEKDFLVAARILRLSDDPDDLLSAHVLAVGACFLKRKNGEARAFAAETLDAFLLAAGRPQVFGSVLAEDGDAPREPCALELLPPVVRAGYESGKRRR